MDQAITIFQALSEPTRLRMLQLLREMELSVGELAQVLGQSQPRVSRHVRILVESGLVCRRKEGSWVFLTLGSEEILAPIFAALDQWHPPAEQDKGDILADRQRLQAIRNLRVDAAQDWFEDHAAEWDAIRSLYVSERDVEAAILSLVGSAPLGQLVDIGTGTGRMLELLAPQAESAIGFDRSPSMLRLARSKLENVQTRLGTRAELRQGDFYALPLANEAVDLAIMHQVLRYAQHPASVLAEAARLLAPGGRLLVVDFATHNREDLRTRDAHASLGFSDQHMDEWFKQAGLKTTPPLALEGELTVKLWLGQLLSKTESTKALYPRE
ncbi:metalloregulator ArsR/SmtB family transcription factor [Aristophania vespae]|uniref:Metalloregulator ArsR/SmtB family transcription factor n=1 Tax=Aristophania vespae TaxID=2697033 RepID=A0A6P1NC99_9PROT|nr:metalloregulator ArsR/SmtB family transcription factor [Aristophania vespae]QHI95079.1 metalloregulator ArsR/SmtB family transcription factor [Aristophania vespae]UMM64268.1 2-methoxy-6-polyprenyl-1,4-benzoquinol methylase, mitochondrial [Aristophania vespae]